MKSERCQAPLVSIVFGLKATGNFSISDRRVEVCVLVFARWSLNTHRNEMPFNDPHTAACRLWSYRIEGGAEFAASAAVFDASKQLRLGHESYLIWQYRRETGSSPACNFGRLHPYYEPSRNRSTGKRGGRVFEDSANPRAVSSFAPLNQFGSPISMDWMGLDRSKPALLSDTNNVPIEPACTD